MAGRNGKRPHRAKKSAAKKTSHKAMPALVPQPNGGALLTGGVPGNAGGSGRPPAAIRATARMHFDALLPIAVGITNSEKAKDVDRLRGLDLLGKYGMSHPISLDDVLACWHEQVSVIRERFAPDISEPLIATLRPIWTGLGHVKKSS